MTPTELFELCKQVYESTGWDDEPNYQLAHTSYAIPPTDLLAYEVREGKEFRSEHWTHKKIPIYTSDCLLERLPKEFAEYDGYHEQDVYYRLTLRVVGNRWLANYTYENVAMHHVFGDTPLKALLKLTLKLHEGKIL